MAQQPNVAEILAALAQQTSSNATSAPQYQIPHQSQATSVPQYSLPQSQQNPPQPQHLHNQQQSGYPQSQYPAAQQQYLSGSTPGQYVPNSQQMQQPPPNFQPSYQQGASATRPSHFQSTQNIPLPINSGRIDVSAIRPSNSGSVNLSDSTMRLQGYSSDRGVSYDGSFSGQSRETASRNGGSSYRPPRSRSRSPQRTGRDGFTDAYSSYRDDRRGDLRQLAAHNDQDSAYHLGSRGRQSQISRSSPISTRGVGLSDDHSEIISIRSDLVGLIIGRQGENLRRVEAETQTRVQFVTPPDTGGSERECKITGTPRARDYAKAEMYRIIEESGKATGYSSGRAPPPADRDMDVGIKGSGNVQSTQRAGEDTSKMMVPNRTVGLIIGKGGETIRDLQERSHCHVNIMSEDKAVGGLRPVNLIGNPEAAKMAKELIMAIVESDAKNIASSVGESTETRGPVSGMKVAYEKVTENINVPSEAVGLIIGKGGETIKEMQTTTSCKINVSQATGRDVERRIELIGYRASIEQAKTAIMEKVRTVQEKRSGGQQQREERHPNLYPQNRQPLSSQQEIPSQTGEPDPYAAYGGYQNYVALWFSSLQANQGPQDQTAQGPPGS